jgi:hypothetical protein
MQSCHDVSFEQKRNHGPCMLVCTESGHTCLLTNVSNTFLIRHLSPGIVDTPLWHGSFHLPSGSMFAALPGSDPFRRGCLIARAAAPANWQPRFRSLATRCESGRNLEHCTLAQSCQVWPYQLQFSARWSFVAPFSVAAVLEPLTERLSAGMSRGAVLKAHKLTYRKHGLPLRKAAFRMGKREVASSRGR